MIAKIPCDLVINGVLTTFDIIMEPGLVDTLKSLDNQIESDTNKLLSSSVKVTTYDGSYIYFKKIDGTELFKLDVTPFKIDGMISNVIFNSTTNNVEITFNNEHGTIYISVPDIIKNTITPILNNKVDKTTTINNYSLSQNISLNKSDIQLNNVKNIGQDTEPKQQGTNNLQSNGAYTSLSKKVDKTVTVNGHILDKSITLNKSDIGLNNISNQPTTDSITENGENLVTSDAIKKALDNKLNLSDIVDLLSYGIQWDTTKSTPDCTRVGNYEMHKTLPIQSSLKGCIVKNKKIQYYLDPTDWTKIEGSSLSSKLDGTDGDVMVHHMAFYGRSFINGNLRQVRISPYKIDDTWEEIPEGCISAYRITVDQTDPTSLKAKSVVNTTEKFRGGDNRSSMDTYLATDPFRSDLGKPRTSINRSTMRTYARNNNMELLDYWHYKWIMYWLPVIEYATFDIQKSFNASLTSDGLHQGGLGPGVTDWNNNSNGWAGYNGTGPIIPCGFTNSLGNFTGIVDAKLPASTSISDSTVTTQEHTFHVIRYRGIEQPFGDIWTNLDGIVSFYNSTTSLRNYYSTNNPKYFGDTKDNKELIASVSQFNNWVKEFSFSNNKAEIIPESEGGGGSSYKCDLHWDNTNTSVHTLMVGGHATNDAWAGLGCLDSGSGVGVAWTGLGFRAYCSV